MEDETCRSLPAMFLHAAAQRGDKPFLWAKRDGVYRATSWSEAATRVRHLARALSALGIARGDRIALVAESRPEWVIADLATMSAGAVTVPAYTTNTVDDHRHILSNSGAHAAIVSTAALAARLLPAAAQVPGLHTIIAIEPPDGDAPVGSARIIAWDAALAQGAALPDDGDAAIAALQPDDIACMIYTSGTGGLPKGVLTSHRNIIANCAGARRLLEALGLGDEVFLSFLPLSHSYEHTAGVMFPISLAAEIYFAERPDTLSTNLIEARPTIMTAVPRLYETLHQRIRLGVERQGRPSRFLFRQAVALGRKRLAGGELNLGERLLDAIAERAVRGKMRARFGGRLKAMVSGGAPLNPDIGSFFLALGVNLLQGYGQTEAAPVIACNPPGNIRIDTVGPPLAGVRVRIAEDGEILVAGDNVMQGYWNDPEATARTLIDGWLHTGDVGALDDDGYLRITDRKRDFIKNTGGDMIAPARVEGALTMAAEIAQAMAFGDQRPYLVAVIVVDPDYAAAYARAQGLSDDMAALAADPGLNKAIGAVVARVNAGLPISERVRRFTLAREAFTVANGQMTPTLKVRRHTVRQVYGTVLEALYDGREAAA